MAMGDGGTITAKDAQVCLATMEALSESLQAAIKYGRGMEARNRFWNWTFGWSIARWSCYEDTPPATMRCVRPSLLIDAFAEYKKQGKPYSYDFDMTVEKAFSMNGGGS